MTLACPQVQGRSQGNSYTQVQGERWGRDSCEPPGEEYTRLGVIEGHLEALTLGVLAPQTLQAREVAGRDASKNGPAPGRSGPWWLPWPLQLWATTWPGAPALPCDGPGSLLAAWPLCKSRPN